MSPWEIIRGHQPSIQHCMPFFTLAHVTVPKENRAKMRKKGLGHLRAETGNLVGFDSMWGTTPVVLLPGNRIVRRRDVTYTKDLPTNTFKRLRYQMMHACTPAA